jgi:hypothetical protein
MDLLKSVVREICTPRSVGTGGGRLPPVTRWMWKRSHAWATEAPPDERGGNGYVQPNATAPRLDLYEDAAVKGYFGGAEQLAAGLAHREVRR